MKRRRLEEELDQDIREHIEMETRENVERGMSPDEARHAALRKFGNITRIKEETRGVWGWGWAAQLWQDARYALRTLRRSPGFTCAAVLSLALGIGANTAIFSVFNGLFLSSLPYPKAERLAAFSEAAPSFKLTDIRVTPADFAAWSESNQTFEKMALYQENGASLAAGGDSIRIKGASVSWQMASTLGIKPILGRDLEPGDRDHVMLMGFALWQSKFHGSPDIVGRVLQLDDEPYTVVGILPPNAVFPAGGDYWAAYYINPGNQRNRGNIGVGRLKPGVTIQQARADLKRVHKSSIATIPSNKSTEPTVTMLRDRYLGDYRLITQVLLGAVGFVLLIACATVAGLMMARGTARTHELAIRVALGAGRRRLIQQLLAESLLLAVAGAAAGVILGWLGLRAALLSMPDILPPWVRFPLDFRFVLFALAVTGMAAIVSGLGPAWAFSKTNVRGFLADAALRSSLSRGRRRGMNLLVVGEIAVAMVLLVGGSLVVKAFWKVLSADPGFRAEGVLTFAVETQYPKPEQRIRFYESLLSALRSTPGVDSAGATTWLPFDDPFPGGTLFRAEGRPARPPSEEPLAPSRKITPGYFRAMGISLRAGREFDDHDGQDDSARAIIVNEAFARHFWPGEANVLGRRVTPGVAMSGSFPWIPVVGVARDVRNDSLDRDARPWAYTPYRQPPQNTVPVQMFFVVRSTVDPHSLIATARQAVRRLDPGLALYDMYTLQERMDRSLWTRRTYSWLFVAFGAIALVMALFGIYGLVSYTVSQRTREIGIRIALGADRRQVVSEVLQSGLTLVAVGTLTGLAGAWFATRLMQSLLAGVSPHDPLAYAVVISLLAVTTLLANLVPALRAASIDPVRALRFE
jgi:putative ABC transport system permease protein